MKIVWILGFIIGVIIFYGLPNILSSIIVSAIFSFCITTIASMLLLIDVPKDTQAWLWFPDHFKTWWWALGSFAFYFWISYKNKAFGW